MKNSVIPEKLTVTDYFAVNIFNSLMNNAGYQVIDKKSIIKESYELAEYMTELKNKGENKNE